MIPLIAIVVLAFNLFSTGPDEKDAYDVAKQQVVEQYRTHVLSIYGKGTPTTIDTWYVKFYDPESAEKARVAVVQNGKVVRFHPAEGATPNDDSRSFDPSQNKVGVKTALDSAAKYAKDNLIQYDATRVYLHRTEMGKAPVWYVELLQGTKSLGRVYTGPDGAFASYKTPEAAASETAEHRATGVGQDVKNTFLGIGGDLEEFFTGERTVDR